MGTKTRTAQRKGKPECNERGNQGMGTCIKQGSVPGSAVRAVGCSGPWVGKSVTARGGKQGGSGIQMGQRRQGTGLKRYNRSLNASVTVSQCVQRLQRQQNVWGTAVNRAARGMGSERVPVYIEMTAVTRTVGVAVGGACSGVGWQNKAHQRRLWEER